MKSVFTDKKSEPGTGDLKVNLGDTFNLWNSFVDFTLKKNPNTRAQWHFSGEKYGWSYRISDKKRVIIYLLPRDGFFKVAFVFGQKATDQILASKISAEIKNDLNAAKVYAEGRGIRIDIRDQSNDEDILQLIQIKIAN